MCKNIVSCISQNIQLQVHDARLEILQLPEIHRIENVFVISIVVGTMSNIRIGDCGQRAQPYCTFILLLTDLMLNKSCIEPLCCYDHVWMRRTESGM